MTFVNRCGRRALRGNKKKKRRKKKNALKLASFTIVYFNLTASIFLSLNILSFNYRNTDDIYFLDTPIIFLALKMIYHGYS